MRTPRQAVLLTIVCCAALAFVLAAPASVHARASEPVRAPQQTTPVVFTDLNITGLICQALKTATDKGIRALIGHFTEGGFDGGLAVTLVVKAGFTKCPKAVTAVGKFVKRLLGVQTKPKTQQLASPESQYLQYLETYRAGRIATLLAPYSFVIRTQTDIFTFANELCYDARNSLNPRTTLVHFVPKADRRSLPALNATVGLVIRGSCPLTATQRSYLALSVTSYVLARARPQSDLVPPVVIMYAPHFTGRYPNGAWAATLRWAVYDTSGIRRTELWERFREGWRGLSDARVVLQPRFTYLFAVRAQDSAGNYSPFSYLSYRHP